MEFNRFGKMKFRKFLESPTINAGKSWYPSITDFEIDSYSPFSHLVIFNYNTSVTLEVRLNSSNLGDDSLQTGTFVAYVLPSSAFELEDKDNVLFNRLVIKNTDGSTNISAKEVSVRIQNF